MSKQEKIAFVTVGSTRFDALVTRVLSEEVVEVLKENGVTTLIVQAGNSTFDHPPGFEQDDEVLRGQIHGLSVEVWTYKPSLKEEYERAALVIGHAGSGTILEVLRLGRRMVAVPNETLLHNHQAELAEALDLQGYLSASSIVDLPTAITTAMGKTFSRFPDYDGSKFSSIIDREMGFT